MNYKVDLRNFWPSSNVGYLNQYGQDTTKLFLESLVKSCNLDTNVILESIYSETSFFDKFSSKFKSLNSKKLSQYRSYEESMNLTRIPGYKYLWYTAENIRPPLHLNYDAFLSHDIDGFDGRNIYLPHWVTRLSSTYSGAKSAMPKLLKKRKLSSNKRKFACAIVSNPERVRMSFINYLSSYRMIDIYGKLGDGISNKFEVLNNYRFNICFENSLHPGYVTEKALDSWGAGSIPVWYGSSSGSSINSKCLVNVAELGFEKARKMIIEIDDNFSEFEGKRNEPFLEDAFNLEKVRAKLIELIS
jgi:hypothetical protein